MLPYNSNLRQLARELRNHMTDVERLLWAKVRMKQLSGCQFYRQKIIGDYIVDFYCPDVKLVIEVDGSQHRTDEIAADDRIRDDFLMSLGLYILRFDNMEVMNNIEGVTIKISEYISEFKSPWPPFSKGGLSRQVNLS